MILDVLAQGLFAYIASGKAQMLTRLLPDEVLTAVEHGGTDAVLKLREWIADTLAERIADGWDRYGAPTVALDASTGQYLASCETPYRRASFWTLGKREGYRLVRRTWIRELLLWD
ncbi:hypothetical protein KQ693_06240 [Thermus sp. PS18]|uniref:hypothetical protein n=1 Tax=Thermus sp. PS18 TaxID=2849039 RepID=UPI0022651E8E|nr:hypothetical protein [Thermus sp. PS18]UZX16627.1 hypothetical protein KQ693_06240 [Thermus sp. PS18]